MMNQMGRMHYRAQLRTTAAKQQQGAILATLEAGEQTLLTDVLFEEARFNPNTLKVIKSTENVISYERKDVTTGKMSESGLSFSAGDEFYLLDNQMIAYVEKGGILLVYSKEQVPAYSLEGRKNKEYYLEKIKKQSSYGTFTPAREIPQEFLTIELIREGLKQTDSFLMNMNPDHLTREMLDLYQERSMTSALTLHLDRADLFTDEEVIEVSLLNENIIGKMSWERLENGLLKRIMDAQKENENEPLNLGYHIGIANELAYKQKYHSASSEPEKGVEITEVYLNKEEDENFTKNIGRIRIVKTEDGREEPLIKWLFDYAGWDINERRCYGFYNQDIEGEEFHNDYRQGFYTLIMKPGNTWVGEAVLNQIKTTFKDLAIQVEVGYRDELMVKTFNQMSQDLLEQSEIGIEELNRLNGYYKKLDYPQQMQVACNLQNVYEKVFKPYEGKKVEMNLTIKGYTWMGEIEKTTNEQGTIKWVGGTPGYGLFPKGSRTKYYDLSNAIYSIKEIKKFD